MSEMADTGIYYLLQQKTEYSLDVQQQTGCWLNKT